MKRQIMLLAAAGLMLGLSLSSCTTTGGIATGTGTIDKTATLKATCDGLQKVDTAFQSFATAEPNVVPANVMDVEGGIVQAFFTRSATGVMTPIGVCAPPYATDLDTALNNLIAATISVTTLLAHWKI